MSLTRLMASLLYGVTATNENQIVSNLGEVSYFRGEWIRTTDLTVPNEFGD